MFEPLPLAEDETIRWHGRPAPRAYTFRNWRLSLWGLALLLPCLIWQLVGIELVTSGAPVWVAWLPLPFNLASLYLAFGQLLIARLEWEQIVYVVSDRNLYQRAGFFRSRLRSLPLAAVTRVRKKDLGPNLATVRIDSRDGEFLLFTAIEHSELLLRLFPDLAGGDAAQKS